MQLTQMKNGFKTAFIDSKYPSNIDYKPQFLYNDNTQGIKVLSTIKNELYKCDEFIFSVAFITMSGLTPLLGILEELRDRGINGKILTTNYLTFTEPKALKKLNEFPNIEVRMYSGDQLGFHTKGYIFRKDDVYKLIVGSSNMTGAALTKNKEWNSVLVSTNKGEYATSLLNEFYSLWKSEKTLGFDLFIEEYEYQYNETKLRDNHKIIKVENHLKYNQLKPNSMQEKFINNLNKIIDEGEDRALLLSATGTGKTYAAAFAVENIKPNKILFLVHREDIARKAMESFKNVITSNKTWGLISGTQKQYEAEYVFSTMNMMSKQEVHEKYEKSEFDVIVIDEAHRSGAESYQRIINYFKPKLLLGMTATPERTDGFDIFKLFGNNIAYEIRLQQAMEEEMLTPFHYFGITDLKIDEKGMGEQVDFREFNYLVSHERVEYIIEKIKYYSFSGPRVKGLVFCSRKDEAAKLSMQFNERGYRTCVLSGDHSQEERFKAIERLVGGDGDEALDYIFTVDIFNEGIDIPEVNQVVMLRPTESPVVFVQQLGRGLRKDLSKEYVVVLDFIGNYSNNFMIPIALSGDKTYNKDNIRRYVMEGERIIPGGSTIYFDEISKKRIYESISNFGVKLKFLKEKYFEMKHRVGRIPSMQDFFEYGEIDPMLFVEYSRSMHNFILKVDQEYEVRFTDDQVAMLEFISAYCIDGKRIHELLLMKELLKYDTVDVEKVKEKYKDKVSELKDIDFASAISVLDKSFVNAPGDKKRYKDIKFIDREETVTGIINRNKLYNEILLENIFRKEMVSLIEYGINRNQKYYREVQEDNLVLYQKYSRKDVCRILNWEKDDSATVYGYRIKYGTCPLFVTYNKKEDISESTKYEDKFIDNRLFSWMSRAGVNMNSSEAKKIMEYKEGGLKLHLFVKQSDAEGSDFYYLGRVNPIDWNETTTRNDQGKTLAIMNFVMELENPVRNDLYDYFVGK